MTPWPGPVRPPAGHPLHPWGGADGWHSYGPLYGWGGYYYSPSYYPYYGSYHYEDSSLSSGALISSGTSGSSEQSASSSPVPSDEGAKSTDKEKASTDKEKLTAERRMSVARQAFRGGDYAEAQKECERAIRLRLHDANLYEFCALCQLAQGKYKDAAANLYDVLAVRPGWEADTLISFYPSEQTYTAQLRALQRYVRDNPNDAAGRFVLAYHYLALDKRAAAAGQLRKVIKLQPRDQVSPGLLEELEEAKDGTGRQHGAGD